jgi:hypothetical protein
MVGTVAMVRPPPRLRTLMDESVRFATERVPACVGLRVVGGGRDVYRWSQRMALAVVRRLAICSCEGGGVVEPVEPDCSVEERGCSVLATEKVRAGVFPWDRRRDAINDYVVKGAWAAGAWMGLWWDALYQRRDGHWWELSISGGGCGRRLYHVVQCKQLRPFL